jgi:hypothetical protein
MERMRRRPRLLSQMRSGEDSWKQLGRLPKVRREPHQEPPEAFRSANQPAPISLGTRRAIITFVVIMGAAILLLVIGRSFLN